MELYLDWISMENSIMLPLTLELIPLTQVIMDSLIGATALVELTYSSLPLMTSTVIGMVTS